MKRTNPVITSSSRLISDAMTSRCSRAPLTSGVESSRSVEPEHGPHGRARVALQPQQVLAHELEMDGHGVQRVSDFVGHAGHQPAERARRQLLADGPERFPDSLELFVRRQVDAADLFAAPQLHEAAVDDVNGTKDAGRQHEADENRRRRQQHRRQQHRPERLREIVANQDGRETDANRAERRVAELERQHHLERAIGVDGANLRDRAAFEHGRKVFSWFDLLAFGGRKAVRDGAAVVVDDGGVRDVVAVDGGRFQDRSNALVGAKRDLGIAAGRNRLARALVDHAAEQHADAAAVFEPDAGEVRQVLDAQRRHRERNQQRDRGGLPGS